MSAYEPEPLLNPKQEKAIDHEMAGVALDEIARRLRVDIRTIRRWRRDPQYLTELRVRRDQQRREIVQQVTKLATKAMTTLEGVMDDRDAHPSSRVAAAGRILDLATKATAGDYELPEGAGDKQAKSAPSIRIVRDMGPPPDDGGTASS